MTIKINGSSLHEGLCFSPAGFENTVFIIDCISTAYAVAIMAKGRAIHCIYECKEITWRKADYVTLFDFILSDVQFLSKKVVFVPHPYLAPSRNPLVRIFRQMNFARLIRRRHPLDPKFTYVSSMVSSLLIGSKRQVKYVLIDEGMGSLVARNRLSFLGRRFSERLKIAIGDRVLSFQFPNRAPQISLTNDTHPSIVKNLDYRKFTSSAFEASLTRLHALMQDRKCNVLVLLKGPPPGIAGHHNEEDDYSHHYDDFNICGILEYFDRLPKGLSPTFFLKSHPSLGNSSGKLKSLLSRLEDHGLTAYDALNYIDFDEASSLPAEGLLRYLPFNNILALDASSLLWNVAYWGDVQCYLPLNEIISFSYFEGEIYTRLYKLQEKINILSGGTVNFFDFKDIR